jgi:hypothetical protein
MRRLAVALRVASAPIGVLVFLWTSELTVRVSSYVCGPPSNPLICGSNALRFALWQCALFGASATVVVLLFSWAGSLTNVLRVASVPVGFVIGVWSAQLVSLTLVPTFAPWQCALFGAGAAVALLLLSLAATYPLLTLDDDQPSVRSRFS